MDIPEYRRVVLDMCDLRRGDYRVPCMFRACFVHVACMLRALSTPARYIRVSFG
jgi:hypothetical protein